MADLQIPGVTESKYQTEKLIDGLMEVKEKKLDSLNEQQQNFEKQRQVWRNLNILTQQLETAATKLYSLDNPFKNRQVASSDPAVMSAEAARGAQIGNYDFQVQALAQAHSLQSATLATATEIAAGVYPFKLGNEEVSVDFAGGTLKDFVIALNEQQSLLIAESIEPSPNSVLMKLTGAKSGAEQRIGFLGKSLELAKDLGFIRETSVLNLYDDAVNSNQEGSLIIAAEQQKRLDLEPAFSLFAGARLVYRYTQSTLTQTTDNQTLRRSYSPYLSAAVYEDVSIEQLSGDEALRRIVLPSLARDEQSERQGGVSFLDTEGNVSQLVELDEQQEKEFSLTPQQLPSKPVKAVLIDNFSQQEMQFSKLRIDYPNTAEGWHYAQQTQEPSNARLEYNATEIERSSNTINDLIPGVEIELKEAQPGKKMELSVVVDYDDIGEQVINFVKNYNDLLTEINILTSRNEAIIDEKINFDEQQRRDATERLGLLQGHTDIIRLANSLRSIPGTIYSTREGKQALSAIGISTNVESISGQIDRRKLRGYLEIDTGVLAQMLEENPQLVKDIFGFDSDKDGVIDSGLAYQVRQISYNYSRTGGTMRLRINSIDENIKDSRERISDYKEYLEDYRAQLKKKYNRMESSLSQLESLQENLKNFSKQ